MVGEALRQAFMQEYEKEGWSNKVQSILGLITLWMMIIISSVISLKIIFPSDPGRRPFCGPNNINNIIASTNNVEIERSVVGGGGAFYLTDQETVDYFWTVVFLPSVVLFAFSAVYLVAGIAVSYAAPARHGCLKVVENNYCASKRGGVRCLSILNFVFAIIFGLLALFLGSTLLTLGSKCSIPLFWCYEISSWGLVMLYGGTAIQLRKKAATILDEADFAARNIGLEMLEANPTEFNPDVERRVNEGFRSWMGSAYLSSDDDDEEIDPNAYQEVQHLLHTNSSRQRV